MPTQFADPTSRSWMTAPGTWFVLRTRSRQEKLLADDLGARNIQCYLPLATVVRYYGSRKARAVLPLFSGYVFLKGDRDQCYLADRTKRIAQILHVSDQQRLEMELTSIAKAIQYDGQLTPCVPMEQGTEVEVTAGPFKGVRGQVDVEARDNRLVLHVDLIGGAAALEIDRDLLRVVID